MNSDYESDIFYPTLNTREKKQLLAYYSMQLIKVDRKLVNLTSGDRTILSDYGLKMMKEIRQVYWRRIQTLQGSLTAKKGRKP